MKPKRTDHERLSREGRHGRFVIVAAVILACIVETLAGLPQRIGSPEQFEQHLQTRRRRLDIESTSDRITRLLVRREQLALATSEVLSFHLAGAGPLLQPDENEFRAVVPSAQAGTKGPLIFISCVFVASESAVDLRLDAGRTFLVPKSRRRRIVRIGRGILGSLALVARDFALSHSAEALGRGAPLAVLARLSEIPELMSEATHSLLAVILHFLRSTD